MAGNAANVAADLTIYNPSSGNINIHNGNSSAGIQLETNSLSLLDFGTNYYGGIRPIAAGSGHGTIQLFGQPGVLNDQNWPLPVGGLSSQNNSGLSTLIGYVETIGATPSSVATRYAPASGHGAFVEVTSIGRDASNGAVVSGQCRAAVKNVSSTVTVVGTQVAQTNTGDSALLSSVVSVTIVSSIVNVTATPPVAYANNIDWSFAFSFLDN